MIVAADDGTFLGAVRPGEATRITLPRSTSRVHAKARVAELVTDVPLLTSRVDHRIFQR